jgi:hypothetical protein
LPPYSAFDLAFSLRQAHIFRNGAGWHSVLYISRVFHREAAMNLPSVRKSVSSVSRAIVICAVSLCFAGMVPAAFAQRGGGGGHVGGGGGHVSSGTRSAGNFSSGSRSSAGYSGRTSGGSGYRASGAPVYASGVTNRGYSRTYFVPEPGSRGTGVSSFVGASSTASGARSFAANNRIWQEPPQQGRAAILARRAFASPFRSFGHVASGSPYAGMTATPPRFTSNGLGPFFNNGFTRFHPIGPSPCLFGGCGFGSPFFNPFFFGFGFSPCFSGFGCGFGPFGYGDLDWGGLGLYGYGDDYGDGWYYPPAEEPESPPENSTEDNQPPNYAPDYYFVPPPGEAEASPAQPQQPVVKLVLKDGTIFGVYSYWAQNNQLYYITTYNIKTSIPLDDLDLQKTVDLNAKLGTTFTLSSKPPDQQQNQQPDDQQQPDSQ